MDNRKFNFGKYKGHEIYSIIIDHTGYILWLFENTHFKLNKVEQELFDIMYKASEDGYLESKELEEYCRNDYSKFFSIFTKVSPKLETVNRVTEQ